MPDHALVVDASPQRARLYQHVLEGERLMVSVASDGAQATAHLRDKGPPRLLLSELSLPKLDGFAVLAALRSLAPVTRTPAIVVSAFRELRNEAFARKEELGIVALLAAGGPAQTLKRAVQSALALTAAGATPSLAETPGSTPGELHDAESDRARVRRLRESGLVDEGQPPDPELQALMVEVAQRFKVPIALVSLVLEDKQWFKAHTGLSGHLLQNRGSTRDWSFCRHAVQGQQTLVVPDAALSPAFSANPLVREGTVRGYAGAPMLTPEGDLLGTLCIIDRNPLALGAEEIAELEKAARSVAAQLSLRQKRRGPAQAPPLPATPSSASTLAACVSELRVGLGLLDPARKVVFLNPAFQALMGIDASALQGQPREALIEACAAKACDPASFRQSLEAVAPGPFLLRETVELREPARTVVWSSRPLELPEGTGQLIELTDITEQVCLLREQEEVARTDATTGLWNRRGGEEMLRREAARCKRNRGTCGLLLADLDDFKRVNDQHGHAAGDEALRRVAAALRSLMRGGDAAIRWGGDEFMAVLPDTDVAGARRVGERLREALKAGEASERVLPITVSCGAAEVSKDEGVAQALALADANLYAAKKAGRDRVR